MRKNLLLVLILTTAFAAAAQTDTITSVKSKRIATINTMDGITEKGWFYAIDNDHVYLLPTGKKTTNSNNNAAMGQQNGSYSIDAEQINTISLKKKNAGLKGALIGLGIGSAIGAIAGFASGSDPSDQWFAFTAGEKAVVFGALGGVTGALIGGIAGALAKKVFTIGGKKDAYRNSQEELNKLAMVKF